MYKSLQDVFDNAFTQASKGKGKERHAVDNKPFENQPIFWIEEHFKSFQLGQAVKKMHESQILPLDHAIAELHGAMVFIAARVISLQQIIDKESKE